MNRTIKEATIRAFHYPDLDALRDQVPAFVSAYNFAKRLATSRRMSLPDDRLSIFRS
jgi:hypothetical protein